MEVYTAMKQFARRSFMRDEVSGLADILRSDLLRNVAGVEVFLLVLDDIFLMKAISILTSQFPSIDTSIDTLALRYVQKQHVPTAKQHERVALSSKKWFRA